MSRPRSLTLLRAAKHADRAWHSERFAAKGSIRIAVESNSHGDEMAAIAFGRDMVEFLKRGPTALEAARQAIAHAAAKPGKALVIDRQQVRLLAPVPRPGALISAGKNFSDHVSEMSSKKGRAIRWHS